MKTLTSIAAASLLALASSTVALAGGSYQKTSQMDIVDTAVHAGSFNTLVTAVQEAGLVETLKGEGPFTVFAPTDEAFAKLPAGDLEALLNNKEALTKVLTYHVVPGKVMAADVAGLTSAPTVEGEELQIDTSNGVMINQARVVKADIEASNGVIHVIDAVLMPTMTSDRGINDGDAKLAEAGSAESDGGYMGRYNR